jgi:hypothetical protein
MVLIISPSHFNEVEIMLRDAGENFHQIGVVEEKLGSEQVVIKGNWDCQ